MSDNENDWGSRRQDYYSNNKRDKEDSDYLEEEEEAMKKQQQKLQKLKEANFTYSDDEGEDNNQASLTIVKKAKKFDLSSSDDEGTTKPKMEDKAENLQILTNLRLNVEEVNENLFPTIEILERTEMKNLSNYLTAKKNMHCLYSIYLTLYLNYKLKGQIPDYHPIVKKMLWVKGLLNNMKNIDDNISTKLDKILKLHQNGDMEVKSDGVEEEMNFLGKKTKQQKYMPGFDLDNYIHENNSKIEKLNQKRLISVENAGRRLKAEIAVKNQKGIRLVNENILKARGIYRKRKNYQGNAKLVNREKFMKKEKLRKNYVKEYTEKPEVYGGEATGIRRDLIRSTKIS
jgi:U3 small nucleolar RNA-associated protein 3